ncbi:Oxygen sensor histidine kinase NreB [Massilia sp. Bi118]|uniref:sensor histidine kinase n=1 Tax=Massilia sp. Bi118 TaxID=2822346 RepID=UPI001DC68EC0|nr:ATP-binding protein [Massilia sp. Bi118]CAH0299134.1 Oxygen sensor histidine kinase NreB [Massilia sp. Bi118]
MNNETKLAPAMQAATTEIYLVDADTLQLVDVNQAARQNLGYELARLNGMTPLDLAPGLDAAGLKELLASLGPEIGAQVSVSTRFVRADGSRYPVKLCFLRIVRDGRTLFLAIGDDQSLAHAASAALQEYQARFNAVVDHTPGLVYQFVLNADGSTAFPYLSEGCTALLGLSVSELQQDPARFQHLILLEDRKGYQETMQASIDCACVWNWEGRIRIEDTWNDVKWINLRATPIPLDGGGMQWDGIMTNITASKLEQEEIKRSRARLAELTEHSAQVKEQERTRIAREIHDDLGGNLTAIKMALAMLAARLPQESALQEKADYLDSLVDRTIEAVHRISLDLRPSTLDLGIVAALEWQAREFETRMGIACVFRADGDDIEDIESELDPDHASALFRIFQESLTNIAKHAGATRVSVTLRRQRQHLSLTICDNGRGITPADRLKPQSFGLRGMKERAKALGGTLSLSPAPGGGTMVAVKIRLAASPLASRQPETTRA